MTNIERNSVFVQGVIEGIKNGSLNIERNSVFVQGVNEGIKNGSLISIDEINSLANIDISQSLARIADSLEKLVSEQNGRDQIAKGEA